MTKFGDQLRKLRLERGMSQEDMAALLGTSKQVISRYETGQRSPKITVASAYAEKLGVPLSDLEGNPPATPTYPNLIPITRTYKIPLLGKIAAGKPIQTNPEDMEFIELPHDPGRANAALRVSGDSMIPRYLNNDIVFIRFQDDVDDGQIAAVCIDDTVTLKKVYHIPNGVYLVSENPAYPPMTYTLDDADNIHLVGLAIGYLRWEH